jgi:hypothetical protein
MVRVEIETKGLDEQIKKLYDFDEVAVKFWRLAMQRTLPGIASAARLNAPQGPTGRTKASIRHKIQKTGSVGVLGKVAAFMPDGEFYPNVVEHGRTAFAPFEGRFFLKSASDAGKDSVEQALAEASEQIVGTLALRELFNVS